MRIVTETVGVDTILAQMQAARENKVNIVILDACRRNPLLEHLRHSPNVRAIGARAVKAKSGLAEIRANINSLIAFATQPGNVAYDGDGEHSPFTGIIIASH